MTIIGTNGLYLYIFVIFNGINLRILEWYGLSATSSMGNYLAPFSGGTIIRAIYLKHKHSLPYASFLSIFAAGYMINYAVISALGVILTSSLYDDVNYSLIIQLLFIASFLTIASLSYIPVKYISMNNRAFTFVNQALKGIRNIKNNNLLIMIILCLTTINIIIGALTYYTAFYAIGHPITFRVSLLVYLLTSFSIIFNITPGNFGIQEFITSFSCSILGIGADLGLLASLIIRGAAVFCAFTLGPLFSYILAKELQMRH